MNVGLAFTCNDELVATVTPTPRLLHEESRVTNGQEARGRSRVLIRYTPLYVHVVYRNARYACVCCLRNSTGQLAQSYLRALE